MKERCKQTSNLEEALGVLLVASNVERRVRSRARLASTLDEALDLLFVGGESGDEEKSERDGGKNVCKKSRNNLNNISFENPEKKTLTQKTN